MNRKRWLGLASVALAAMLSLPAMGQEFAKVGTTGAQFLKIDIGARSMGMSGVNQLIRGDVEALYQNPAGLAWATKPQAMLSHTKWLADMPYSAVAAMYPVKNIGVIGAFVGHLSSGDIEETTVEQQDGTGKMVSTGHTVMGIGYGRQLTDKFTVGGVLKYVSERLDDVNSNALSVDVGISYDIGIKGVSLGMAIRNFGPEIKSKDKYIPYDNGTALTTEPEDYLSYQFPLTFKTGIGWEIENTDQRAIRIGADLEHPNDNVERLHLGGEYVFHNLVAARAGYVFRHDTAGLSAGVGFLWHGMRVDYAFVDYGILDTVQRFDFVFTF